MNQRTHEQNRRRFSNAEVLSHKARENCAKFGGKITNHEDMVAATKRVMRDYPDLARAYIDDQNGECEASLSAGMPR